ncbi:MAG: 2-oxoglutarate dehydrogenase E1 component [Candidatus Latescibacterota bacterium]|jgi:2-oxoglutarate dehydrogenase E1 component
MLFDPRNASAEYIDELYEQFRTRPDSLDPQWVAFFRGFEFGYQRSGEEQARAAGPARADKGVHGLVQAYRQLGHFTARLDPLGHHRDHLPLLDPAEYGLDEDDLDRLVGTGGFLGPTDGTLRGLLAALRTTYCGSLGVEYLSIADKAQRDWLQQRIEPALNRTDEEEEDGRRILARLVEAEELEQFLHTRYVGQKRFSLEGAEALVPLVDAVVVVGADLDVEELVIGMAHRGRLNVLAHLLHKPYEMILSEFEGALQAERADTEGDVKYHMGYSHDVVTESGRKVHLSLSSNPSHLELVDPVIEGTVYAKQSYLRDRERRRVVPLLIHGEAAFAGQGIVTETLNLSQLDGYHTGGTVHVIINNQLGYTATPDETRFTPYPTDVARQMQAPVFHVNADDPEAVVRAARLAIAFRQTFKRDVLIDLWCYRRYGHNEADDPTLTQPLMYREIEQHPTVTRLYAARLADEGRVSAEDYEDLKVRVRARLDEAQEIARRLQVAPRAPVFGGVWQGLTWAGEDWSAHTAVDHRMLERVASRATAVPEGFTLHRTVERLVRARHEMVAGQRGVDWGCAEMLAFGTLLLEGLAVRLAGQDSQRGTFAHRHAVWHDVNTGARHVPLAHLARDQAEFTVYNTMLSELAVLGFEYGASTTDPQRLVLWEAQFGDFVNGAQMIVDQFLVSGEAKWQRMCGLVLLLPHAYEGMGPEHSSGRLERFLQLCAKGNLQVASPTTPAQLFHVLRRQMHRNFRKPLVLMTPKSLLRHKLCVSPIEEFSGGAFRPVLADDDPGLPEETRRLLLCSGKIYYEILEARQQAGRADVALARVEQLYPFPRRELEELLGRYPRLEEVFWVQEESQNMGAWTFVRPLLEELVPVECNLGYVGRDEAASPATGSHHVHQAEQREILSRALAVSPPEVPLAAGHRLGSRPGARAIEHVVAAGPATAKE